MERKYVTCDGCEKNLDKEKSYHKMDLSFNSYMRDTNTNQLEEVSAMHRNTSSTYCSKCFTSLVDHMEEFLTKVSPSADHLISNLVEKMI